MILKTSDLTFSYDASPILDHLNLSIGESELIAFLGPNGVGKTTLFRSLLGFLKPQEGSITLNGKEIGLYTKKELASYLAYIPQSYSPAFNHTVLDSVLMGVSSQLGVFETPGKVHEEKAKAILKELGIENLAERGSMQISGGERQLMLLGRALIQEAKILIMDEPTANLDFGNSYRVMQKLRELKEKGYTILFSTHDPNQALSYSSRVICMEKGRILSDTKPEGVTPEVLSSLYSVPVALCPTCGKVGVKP